MDFVASKNMGPFALLKPNATGVDLGARSLKPAAEGLVGRFSSDPKSQHDKLVGETRTWVAQTFFGTLLKQMRDSPFKSDLFSGGQGGQAFGGLYDQQLAEHMTRGAGSKLVNAIVRRIEAQAAYAKQGGQGPQGKQQAGKAGQGGPVENAARADNRTDPRRSDADAAETRTYKRSNGSPTLRP